MKFPNGVAPADRVLVAIYKSANTRPTMSDVADVVGVSRQTVTFHVNRLIDEGYVSPRPTGAHHVTLTTDGEFRANYILDEFMAAMH